MPITELHRDCDTRIERAVVTGEMVAPLHLNRLISISFPRYRLRAFGVVKSRAAGQRTRHLMTHAPCTPRPRIPEARISVRWADGWPLGVRQAPPERQGIRTV